MAANDRWLGAAVAAGVLVLAGGWLDAARADVPDPAAVQKTCPVLTGNPIDPNIYADYQGKRVYFCCTDCKAAFAKDPGKYLSRLPQFAGAAAVANQEHEHEAGLEGLVEPLGITTLGLVAVTVVLGFIRRMNPRPILKLHKVIGVAALVSGATHGLIVLLH